MPSGEIKIGDLPQMTGSPPLSFKLVIEGADGTVLANFSRTVTDSTNMATERPALPDTMYRDPEAAYAIKSTPPAAAPAGAAGIFKQPTFEDVAAESIAWANLDGTKKLDHIFRLTGSGSKTIALPDGQNPFFRALGGGAFAGFVYLIGFNIPAGMTVSFTPPPSGALVDAAGASGTKVFTGYKRVRFALMGNMWDVL